MKVRVLGCSGAISKDGANMAFLLDGDVLLDAGTGVGDLRQELSFISAGNRYPIYITHTRPAETDLIMAEIERFDQTVLAPSHGVHDIRWLRAGQEFEL